MIEDKNSERTPLSELGEFGLINYLTKYYAPGNDSTVKGIGDDAAVVFYGEKQLLVTTDMLIEGVHFNLSYMPLKHLGYKAVVVNLSDICAMNARPGQITVSMAVSNRFTIQAVEALYEGVKLACKIYKVDLVGGDTCSSAGGLQLSLTALGAADKNDIVYRKGAREGDLLVVSGDLGGAYMGLQVLERERAVFEVNPKNQPDLSAYNYLIERQLKPEARTDIIDLLQKLQLKPTAMIDISDGLASEVLHLCRNSEVGVCLYEDKIPLDPQTINVCEEFNLDSTTISLSGGEDYELLFTIDPGDYPRIKGNPDLTVIGHLVNKTEGRNLITRANTQIELKARGWNAFRN